MASSCLVGRSGRRQRGGQARSTGGQLDGGTERASGDCELRNPAEAPRTWREEISSIQPSGGSGQVGLQTSAKRTPERAPEARGQEQGREGKREANWSGSCGERLAEWRRRAEGQGSRLEGRAAAYVITWPSRWPSRAACCAGQPAFPPLARFLSGVQHPLAIESSTVIIMIAWRANEGAAEAAVAAATTTTTTSGP